MEIYITADFCRQSINGVLDRATKGQCALSLVAQRLRTKCTSPHEHTEACTQLFNHRDLVVSKAELHAWVHDHSDIIAARPRRDQIDLYAALAKRQILGAVLCGTPLGTTPLVKASLLEYAARVLSATELNAVAHVLPAATFLQKTCNIVSREDAIAAPKLDEYRTLLKGGVLHKPLCGAPKGSCTAALISTAARVLSSLPTEIQEHIMLLLYPEEYVYPIIRMNCLNVG